jgi:2'-5' RNA ligase
VAIAISGWFDRSAELSIRTVWKKMAESGVDETLHHGPYRPHVTLGIWNDLTVDDAVALTKVVASRCGPVRVQFEVVGMFVHPEAAVFLAPTVSFELRTLHERVHNAAQQTLAVPFDYHIPGCWNPHCTLAWNLAPEALSRAVTVALAAVSLPLTATINQIGIIETPAEIVHNSFPLID